MSRKALKFEVNPLLSGPTFNERSRSGVPYRVVAVNDIDVDPDQPRRSFDAESIAELASSIETYGLLCPILVKLTAGGTYKLVSGERRLRACKALGRETIPVILDDEDSDASVTLAKQLVENIQRSDLNPMEKALAIGHMKERFNMSIRDIANHLGISKSSVQRSVDLLGLPDDLQAALIGGASESKILALSRVNDLSKRKKLLADLDRLSRLDIEEELENLEKVGKLSHRGTALSAKDETSKGKASSDRRIEEEIQRSIGLKVQIRRSKSQGNKGRCTIDFYSDSDLNEIYQRLLASS